VFYLLAGLIIMVMNFTLIPAAFSTIFTLAFGNEAIAGGVIGAIIRYGVARGVFSNEAGLGSAPIAAAAAKTDMPGRQGLVSMTQVFLDTIIVCSITGLTIVMAGLYESGTIEGGALTSASFGYFIGGSGPVIVAIGLIFFASSTIIGWSYYGEKCFQYLVGTKKLNFLYRLLFVVAVMVGAVSSLDMVWLFADVMNGLMAVPNLIGLLGLSGVVAYETRRIKAKIKEEKAEARSKTA